MKKDVGTFVGPFAGWKCKSGMEDLWKCAECTATLWNHHQRIVSPDHYCEGGRCHAKKDIGICGPVCGMEVQVGDGGHVEVRRMQCHLWKDYQGIVSQGQVLRMGSLSRQK